MTRPRVDGLLFACYVYTSEIKQVDILISETRHENMTLCTIIIFSVMIPTYILNTNIPYQKATGSHSKYYVYAHM